MPNPCWEKNHMWYLTAEGQICWKVDQIWAKVQFLQIGHVQIIQKCNFLEKKSPRGVSLGQKGALNHKIWAKVNNHIWLLSAVCVRSTIIYDSWQKLNNHIWLLTKLNNHIWLLTTNQQSYMIVDKKSTIIYDWTHKRVQIYNPVI